MATNNKIPHGRIVIIHGARFRTKDKINMENLGQCFREQGFEVIIPQYGFLPAFIIGLFLSLDKHIAESMAGFIHEDDILVGHSNGATLVYLISQYQKIRGAVLINAALDTELVPNAAFVHVYYNKDDDVAELSKFVPFHIWGNMGTVGYEGDDSRVTNFDTGNPVDDSLPKLSGHSDIFTEGKIRAWACFISGRCLSELAKTDNWSIQND